jgi:hypothetical protein
LYNEETLKVTFKATIEVSVNLLGPLTSNIEGKDFVGLFVIPKIP